MKPRTVLVVRNDDRFSESLRENGFEVLNLEVIKTEPVDDLSELHSKLAQIDDYDGLFFTSPAAAEVFVEQLKITGASVNAKAYALGDRAKIVLEGAGLSVVSSSTANTAGDLIQAVAETDFAGKKLLFVRGNLSMRTIPTLLSGVAEVDEVIVYRTVAIKPDEQIVREADERLKEKEIDWICFFSPSGVESFGELFDTSALIGVRTAAIGVTTARKAAESGFSVEFVPQRTGAFAEEFIEFCKRSE